MRNAECGNKKLSKAQGVKPLDFGFNDSYSSSTPYRIMLHKVTLYDYEDEDDDEDDLIKLDPKFTVRFLKPET
jgi:hypothetical protein